MPTIRTATLALAACLVAAAPGLAAGPPVKLVPYKTTKTGPLTLAIHRPAAWKVSDKRPAIVFFFGGGWANGSMDQFTPQAEHFARRGLVAIRADYRVKSRQGVTPVGCVEDARSALRWVRAHAAELGVDPDRIVASGGSAGGHIAACTAVAEAPDGDGDNLAVSPKPNAMILFNPVLSFVGAPKLIASIGQDEAMGRRISPLLHAGKETPPTLLLYGTEDPLHKQGVDFHGRATKAGVKVGMFLKPFANHGFFNKSPAREEMIGVADKFLVDLGYLPPRPGR